MASNSHYNGKSIIAEKIDFDKTIDHINIFVDDGVTFKISFDGGQNYFQVPPGYISMPVGPVINIVVSSSGIFNLIGIQA